MSQPRQPCFKLNQRFQEQGLSYYVNDHCIGGWFFRVPRKGVNLLSVILCRSLNALIRNGASRKVPVHYLNVDTFNKAAMNELVALEPLAESIKKVFHRRLETGVVEEWDSRLLGRKAS